MDYDHVELLEARLLSCCDIEELLDPYLDGELGAQLKKQLERHLTRCEACHSLVLDCEHILKIAKSLGEQPIPADVSRRLRARLAQEMGLTGVRKPPNLSIVKS